MTNTCEHLKVCGFFNNFKGNSETINQGWIKLFCENLANSEFCERKQFNRRAGCPPVDNMAPTGKLL
jgi:hypothetical protein